MLRKWNCSNSGLRHCRSLNKRGSRDMFPKSVIPPSGRCSTYALDNGTVLVAESLKKDVSPRFARAKFVHFVSFLIVISSDDDDSELMQRPSSTRSVQRSGVECAMECHWQWRHTVRDTRGGVPGRMIWSRSARQNLPMWIPSAFLGVGSMFGSSSCSICCTRRNMSAVISVGGSREGAVWAWIRDSAPVGGAPNWVPEHSEGGRQWEERL